MVLISQLYLGFCKSLVTLKLNIVKNFAHFNKCHCITDTIYINKKYYKRHSKIFTLLRSRFNSTSHNVSQKNRSLI